MWCVKGIPDRGSTYPNWGFGLLRLSDDSHGELFGFEEIDYGDTCSGQVIKYSCEGSSVSTVVIDLESGPEEYEELSVSAEEMRGLSECEEMLDKFYYAAEEDEDPSCGYFVFEEKVNEFGQSFWTESFDAWVYQVAKHINQAGTHMELLPD